MSAMLALVIYEDDDHYDNLGILQPKDQETFRRLYDDASQEKDRTIRNRKHVLLSDFVWPLVQKFLADEDDPEPEGDYIEWDIFEVAEL